MLHELTAHVHLTNLTFFDALEHVNRVAEDEECTWRNL